MGRIRGRELQRRRAALFAAEPTCRRCRTRTPPRYRLATQADHIVPLFKGGDDTPSNLQPLCDECHDEKTAEDCGHRLMTRTNPVDGWPA